MNLNRNELIEALEKNSAFMDMYMGLPEDRKISIMRKALSYVPDRGVQILYLRHVYTGGETLENVSRELGITKERVRQIQEKYERRIREIASWLKESKDLTTLLDLGIEYHVAKKYAEQGVITLEQAVLLIRNKRQYPDSLMRTMKDGLLRLRKELMMQNLNPQNHELLGEGIEVLDLRVRPYNALKKAGITTIKALITAPRSEIEALPHLGEKSTEVIEERLSRHGLRLNW